MYDFCFSCPGSVSDLLHISIKHPSLSPCVYKYKTTVYNYKVTEQTNRFQTQLGPDEGSDKV